jgi:hypothetical protein
MDALIEYVPFVVLMVHAVVDVGGVGDVEMQAFVTATPDASWTVPKIITDCFVLVGDGVGVTGRSVSVRSGVAVGATVRVGDAGGGS